MATWLTADTQSKFLSMSLPSPRLPTELYRQIIKHITDSAVLFNLAVVSRTLGYEAELALYRVVILVPDDVDWSVPRIRALKRRNRSRFVRKLTIFDSGREIFPEAYKTQATQWFWMTFSYFFPTLCNLNSLCISDFEFDMGWVFDGCPPMLHLRQFLCSGIADEQLQHFVCLQSGLEELSITGSELSIPSHAIPHVRVLQCDLACVQTLVAGRPVTHLSVYRTPERLEEEADAIDFISSLSQSTASFLALRCGLGPLFTPENMRFLAEKAPRLRYFDGIRVQAPDDVNPLLDCLQLFPELHTIVIRDLQPESARQSLANTILARYRALKILICYPVYDEEHLPETADLFVAQSLGATCSLSRPMQGSELTVTELNSVSIPSWQDA